MKLILGTVLSIYLQSCIKIYYFLTFIFEIMYLPLIKLTGLYAICVPLRSLRGDHVIHGAMVFPL